MNKILILTVLLVAGLTGSFTTARKNHAIVVRDCTGTYLRIGGDDYMVCNKSILTDMNDGEMVSVSYKKVKECPPTDEMTCMMYHEHKGIVRVTKVKWRKGAITDSAITDR